jgi:hypothetical protein
LGKDAIQAARERAREFAREHTGDPWLRSAGLLTYTLRSRQRGFLEDPDSPFVVATVDFLAELAEIGGPAGLSPLAETVIEQEIAGTSPALGRAVGLVLESNRDQIGTN